MLIVGVYYMRRSNLLYCLLLTSHYSHRINPVEGSTKVLQVCATKKNATSVTSQTGYKRNPVGLVLYWWTMVTYVGWMFLLAGVSYVYMDNLDDDANTVFILKAWAVVWNIGLFWSFVLKWPLSIKSLFLRRCPLAEATEVSVYHEIEQGPEVPDEPSIFPKAMEGFVDGFRKGMSAMMTAIFADAGNRPDPRKAIVEYCPVLTNADGTKYFVFLFRRYNYDDEKKIFVPGIWKSGKTFRDIAPKGIEPVDETELAFELAVQGDGGESDTSQSSGQRSAARKKYRVHGTGLTKEQVDERFRTVGRNQIDMTKPSFLASFSQECTKPFYVYQFYILWIWITTQYWHMAIVNWGIIFSTICVVAWLRYQGALVLYGLSNITGTASVLRDGAFVDVDQQQLVPGDTVRLYPGITYCDMLLLTGEAIVDESALTGEATPQAKAPIDVRSEDTYDPKNHKNKLISAGTKILECEDALAVVKNTASYTMKGELLRNIIAFRRYTPKLEGQLPMLVAILIAWSSILFFLVLFNSSDVPVIAWTLGM